MKLASDRYSQLASSQSIDHTRSVYNAIWLVNRNIQRTNNEEFKSEGAKPEDNMDLMHSKASLMRPITKVDER
jgi:hypothetical protein